MLGDGEKRRRTVLRVPECHVVGTTDG